MSSTGVLGTSKQHWTYCLGDGSEMEQPGLEQALQNGMSVVTSGSLSCCIIMLPFTQGYSVKVDTST